MIALPSLRSSPVTSAGMILPRPIMGPPIQPLPSGFGRPAPETGTGISRLLLNETTIPLTISRSSGVSPQALATRFSTCPRASCAAAMMALPVLQVMRLATVCHSYGL